MLKYADRGLVKNGRVSKLFEQLYIIMTGGAGIWGIAMGFFAYFTNGDEKNFTLTKICKKESDDFLIVAVGLKANSVSFVYNLIIIFLYLNAKGFIKKKSKEKQKLPVIFGRYQRNVMTYKQDVLLGKGSIKNAIFLICSDPPNPLKN